MASPACKTRSSAICANDVAENPAAFNHARPDPMDITGTDILQTAHGGRRDFQFVHGLYLRTFILAVNQPGPS